MVRYVPLLIGLFIGVPVLAREHEQRTLLLAWSQDVSPARWLWTRLALLGLAVATLTGALSVGSEHLAHVYARTTGGGLFDETAFLATGMLPLAAGVCWLPAGVTLGAAARRTLPAMAAVIAGFIGLMFGLQRRYPTLLTPLSFYRHFGEPDLRVADPNALIVNGRSTIGPGNVSNVFDVPGHELTSADLERLCPDIWTDPHAVIGDCLARNHLLSYVSYQPSSRIPAFHLIIAGGYLGLTAVALGTVWLIVRRTSLSAG